MHETPSNSDRQLLRSQKVVKRCGIRPFNANLQITFIVVLPKVIIRYGSNFYTILHVTSSLIYVSSFSKFLLFGSRSETDSVITNKFLCVFFHLCFEFSEKKENYILYHRKYVLTPRPNPRILLARGRRPRASNYLGLGLGVRKLTF